ncbi:hypothetical protein AN958_03293 [Leucoagaricus sp. SymC.cos]|nr:hypothetical protein AN958_03293 [Leucoagaricus sp. SymC.cos]
MSSSTTPPNSLPTIPPHLLKSTQENWIIGMIIGSICYGILFTLGIACLRSLRLLPRQDRFWSQRRILMIHVALLLVLNTVLLVKNARANLVAVFDTRPERLTYFYLDRANILVVIVLAMTDGLLVWRCYMVQRVLLQGKPARWNHLCWVIPMILWIAFTGSGIAAVVVFDPTRLLALDPEPLTLVFLLLSSFCNFFLNLFSTTNIVIRLLIHRRTMIASFGPRSTLSNFHLQIIGIILESAVINLPMAIASATCSLIVGGFGFLAWQIGVPAQSFSSVLVIYQVAKGRAVGSERIKRQPESHHLDTLVYSQEA